MMAKHYVPLEQTTLQHNTVLAHPPVLPALVHMDDPAISVMIDFTLGKFIHIDINHQFKDIERCFMMSGMSDLLVLNQDRVVGVASTRDFHDIKRTQIIRQQNIKREEITAKMLTIPCSEMLVFNYQDIIRTRVGNVVESFNQCKKRYALVVESSSDMKQQYIKGLVDNNETKQIVRGLIIKAKLRAQLANSVLLN